MSRLSGPLQQAIETIDGATMLAQVERWARINSGTSNLEGLARMAEELSEAFSALPGAITLEEPAPVTAVDASGKETAVRNGKHFVLRVRPEAKRRFILTGHMDTVFPADHPFQDLTWLDDDVLNGPGTADMKGGLAIILAALTALADVVHGRGATDWELGAVEHLAVARVELGIVLVIFQIAGAFVRRLKADDRAAGAPDRLVGVDRA